MPDKPPKRQYPPQYVWQLDLQSLHNDLIEFHDDCMFFCDFLLGIAALKSDSGDATANGAREFVDHLKRRGDELNGRFKRLGDGRR